MMEQARLLELSISDVIPTGENPRLVNEESEKFKTLAASVAAEGVKEPVKVRPHPGKKGKYDLRDGARRYRASQLAGKKTIPALVYDKMTDAEAFEMTFIPFFGREDLSLIEESKAVSMFLEKYDGDTKAVSEKLGQTERWVKLRANVFENLSREWIKAVEANQRGDFEGWTISHLELIARFDRETQSRLLDEYRPWNTQTVKELAQWCNNQLRLLKNAPWGMDDELADKDGCLMECCAECRQRSDREPLLWDDDDIDASESRCLNAACFEAKKIAAVKKLIEIARAKHPSLQLVATGSKNESLTYHEKKKLIESFDAVSVENLEAAKKSDPDAVPCMVLTGPSAGKIRYRKKPKKAASTGSGSGTSAAGKTLEQKRDELGRKRWAQVIKKLRPSAIMANYDDLAYDANAKGDILLALISALGTDRYFGSTEASPETAEFLQNMNKVMSSPSPVYLDIVSVQEKIWERGVLPRILQMLDYTGPITQTPDVLIQIAGQVGKLLGISIDALHEKACKEIPEPAAWSKPAAQEPKKINDKKKGVA